MSHPVAAGTQRWGLVCLALVALAVVAEALLGHRPLAAHAGTILLISQEFPQVPLKPLHLVSGPPDHQEMEFDSPRGAVVADLFVPARRFGPLEPSARPALVLAMGIKTAPKDRPIILGFADTLARLGFVVLWPRLKVLDQGVSLPEEPETFVLGVRYLESLDGVDRGRISLVGFSVGASTALVAAHHPEIADRVRAVVFFGGYYDAFDYLLSLATRTSDVEGETIAWTPADEAVGHMREIFAAKEADGLLDVLGARTPDEARSRLSSAPEEEMRELRRFSPAHSSGDLKARLFILHDTGDPYVPYLESAKLHRALSGRVETTYLVTNLFDHVQPRAGLSVEMLEQAVRLYGFVHAALGAL